MRHAGEGLHPYPEGEMTLDTNDINALITQAAGSFITSETPSKQDELMFLNYAVGALNDCAEASTNDYALTHFVTAGQALAYMLLAIRASGFDYVDALMLGLKSMDEPEVVAAVDLVETSDVKLPRGTDRIITVEEMRAQDALSKKFRDCFLGEKQ